MDREMSAWWEIAACPHTYAWICVVWYVAVVHQQFGEVSHSLPCSHRRDAIEVQECWIYWYHSDNMLSRRILLMIWTHPRTAPLPYKAVVMSSSAFWHFCNHFTKSSKPTSGICSCECMESWQCLGSLITQALHIGSTLITLDAIERDVFPGRKHCLYQVRILLIQYHI